MISVTGSGIGDRPLCRVCGINGCRKNGNRFLKQEYKPQCSLCWRLTKDTRPKPIRLSQEEARRRENLRKKRRKHSWLKHRKDHCEMCGFVAEHRCQLDVDHIDGDRQNNDPSNYQTLCANCHRLKTQRNKDYLPKPMRDACIGAEAALRVRMNGFSYTPLPGEGLDPTHRL